MDSRPKGERGGIVFANFKTVPIDAQVVEWQDIADAKKDGTEYLFAGKFRPTEGHPGGEWVIEKWVWSTIMSDGTGHQWIGPGFTTFENWAVDWSGCMPLPAPPGEQ